MFCAPLPPPPLFCCGYNTVIRPSRAEVISFVLYSEGITLCRSAAAADTQLPPRTRRFCFNPVFLLLFCCVRIRLDANKKNGGGEWGLRYIECVHRCHVVWDPLMMLRTNIVRAEKCNAHLRSAPPAGLRSSMTTRRSSQRDKAATMRTSRSCAQVRMLCYCRVLFYRRQGRLEQVGVLTGAPLSRQTPTGPAF